MTGSRPSTADFPELYRELFRAWGPIKARFEPLPPQPPDGMISHVRVVPFVGEQVVVIRMEDGCWDHPGGTLEPEERYIDAVARELMEEAGARLIDFQSFGVFHSLSLSPRPYRPHLPHPEFYHLAGFAEVEVVGEPTNPAFGENVLEVACVSIEEACTRLRTRDDGAWQAELYRLADSLRR